jgi:hypothetical protein
MATNSISDSGKLEPYPCEFSVVSDAQQLEKELQDRRTGWLNINIGGINIVLLGGGGITITIVALAIYFASRKK